VVADSNGAHLLTDRYSHVVRVLNRVLVLNLAVAAAKIVLGYMTGAVSILSDGFHSLTDSASNVVASDVCVIFTASGECCGPSESFVFRNAT